MPLLESLYTYTQTSTAAAASTTTTTTTTPHHEFARAFLAFAARYTATPGIEIEARFGRWSGTALVAGLPAFEHSLLAEYLRRRLATGFRVERTEVREYMTPASAEERVRFGITGDVRILASSSSSSSSPLARRAKRLVASCVHRADQDARFAAAVEVDLPPATPSPEALARMAYRQRRRESYIGPGVRLDVSVVDTFPGAVRTHELELEVRAPLPSVDELAAVLALLATPTLAPAAAAAVVTRARTAAYARTRDFMPLPRTLRRAHLPLAAADFCVTDKADGTRALLVVTDEGAFLVTRQHVVHPLRGRALVESLVECDVALAPTLVDGELVTDVRSGALVFLVFDALCVRGEPVASAPLPSRVAALTDVLMPALAAYTGAEYFPFALAPKRYYPLAAAARVFADGRAFTSNGVRRAVDGLIIAPLTRPYAATDALYKWKPADAATVDLRFDVRNGRLSVRTDDARASATVVTGSAFSDADRARLVADSHYFKNGVFIVECRYDVAAGRWAYVRARTDKRVHDGANHASVFTNVLVSHLEALALDDFTTALP